MDKQERIAQIQKEMREKLALIKENKEKNLTYFFKPFASARRNKPYQQEIIDFLHHGKKVSLAPAPNKVGKTAVAANIVISWALGFEPWNRVDKDHPKAVKVKNEYYHESSLGIRPPVKIRITGEDWTHSVGQVIVPELRKWAPAGLYETKKNSQGVEYFWKWYNGSTYEIMTHDQDTKLFESWIGDGWLADEPPPYPIWSAMSRGLFTRGGKVLMLTTPLRQAWVLDELVLSGRPDVGVLEDLNIWDNPELYKADCDTLISHGLSDAQIEEYWQASMKFKDAPAVLKRAFVDKFGEDEGDVRWGDAMQNLKIERFVQDIPESERMPRLYGQFKALVGRVVKEYNPDIHDIEPFEIPADWPVTAGIDFHLGKPHAISFFATDPRGIDYVIDEVWENLNPEGVADELIRRKRKHGWRLEMAFIDPLSKGDLGFLKNRFGDVQDAFTIIRNRLSPHGINLQVASKDKVAGVVNLQSKFKGANGLPTMYMFNTCHMHRHQLLRWVYDDDPKNPKPLKEDDDFPENMYRMTLFGVKYTDMADVKRKITYGEAGIV